MSNELMVACGDQKLSDSLYSALSGEYCLHKYNIELPTLDEVKLISPLLIIIEANLFNAKPIEYLVSYSSAGYKSLIYGGRWSDSQQIRAYTCGISGYCNEDVKSVIVQEAVKSILQGGIWIKHHLISKVINTLLAQKQYDRSQNEVENNLFEILSNRELDVVRRVQIGESNREIADKLYISERTVKAHLSSTYRKLNVSDRLQLVVLLQKYLL